MTPTQAQIEAEELCAALDKMAQRFGARFAADQQKVAAYVAALTAAAEAGGPSAEQIEARWEQKFKDAVRNIENKAIERCARVAEDCTTANCRQDVAAAIRALKD